MNLLIFYLLLALGVSFVCSLLEAVLLSTNPSYIETLVQKQKRSGKLFRDFQREIEVPLAAILSINTIAHTVGAAGVGAQAVIVFKDIPLAMISAVLTFLILVFSEIIPKTLGATYWRPLAPLSTYTLKFLVWISYPFVMLSRLIQKLIPKSELPSVSRSEISALAEIGKREGVFEESESRIIKNLFLLKKIEVSSVMTPRTVMFACNQDESVQTFLENNKDLRFSRIPIFQKDLDNITGYVHKNDLYQKASEIPGETELKELKRDTLMIPLDTYLFKLFDLFLAKKEHFAIVVDHFGTTVGVVTLEDVLETLIGMEIVDEFDKTDDLQKIARKKWKQRAKRLGLLNGPSSQKEGESL